MGLWRSSSEHDFVTLYRGEDIHPYISQLFEWADEHVWYYMPEVPEDVYLAGGAIRSYFEQSKPRDYDLYFGSQNSANTVGNRLAGAFNKVKHEGDSELYRLTAVLRDGRLTDHTFNLITNRQYPSASAIIETFDFRVCMAALSKEAFVYHPEFFTDLATKTLVVNNLDDPLATMWRMQKYTRKGFTIPMEEAWRVAEGIHALASLPKVTNEKEPKEGGAVPLANVFRSS